MKAHTRRGIAYIAGRLVSGKYSTTLRDDSESKHFSFGGEVNAEKGISVYDYGEGCFIRGDNSSGPFSLYHDGNANWIEFTIDGNRFKGHDKDSSSFFSGIVNGDFVTVHDDEFSQDFKYLL